MSVVNILAPVFLVIAVGAVLLRTGFVTAGFLREANRVTYWLGLPALLFVSLAESLHDAGGAKVMLTTMVGATLAVVLVGYLFSWLCRVKPEAAGTFVQAMFRGNLAFVGLPVIYSIPDAPGANGPSARAAAVLVLAPILVLYNVLGVVVLLVSQHAIGWGMLKPLGRQLATTPPLLATLAGITFGLFGWKLPGALSQSLEWLGQMALPLALLGVGGALVQVKLDRGWLRPFAAGFGKAFLSPLIGYAVAAAVGLSGAELKMVLLFLATPTAAISYTLATQMKGDEAMASGAILFSTLLSIASLTLVLQL